ncbi:MAG: hypothetical protein ABSH20_23515, partial [Tepidisphaeraceae bacterium]
NESVGHRSIPCWSTSVADGTVSGKYVGSHMSRQDMTMIHGHADASEYRHRGLEARTTTIHPVTISRKPVVSGGNDSQDTTLLTN